MSLTETEFTPATPLRPRTVTVLGMLIAAAAGFSYLGAYAVANALRAADVITWPDHADPRPRWMVFGFTSLLALFILLSLIFRRMSKRQLRSIDALADEADEAPVTSQGLLTAKSEH